MKIIKSIVVCTVFMTSFAGCWITRNWRDYLPITAVGLTKGVHEYSGFFTPEHDGVHTLSLSVNKGSEGIDFDLDIQGEVTLVTCGKGASTISFRKKIGRNVCLPPSPFKLHLTSFVANRCGCGECVNSFHLKIHGDVDALLSRIPGSMLVVSFAEGE